MPTTVGLLAALSEASAECFFSDGSVGVRLLRRMKEDDRASIMGRFEWQPTAFEPTAATYEVEADTRGMLLLWSFQTHIETVTATTLYTSLRCECWVTSWPARSLPACGHPASLHATTPDATRLHCVLAVRLVNVRLSSLSPPRVSRRPSCLPRLLSHSLAARRGSRSWPSSCSRHAARGQGCEGEGGCGRQEDRGQDLWHEEQEQVRLPPAACRLRTPRHGRALAPDAPEQASMCADGADTAVRVCACPPLPSRRSKQVQQQIAQMKQAAGASNRDSVRSRTTEIWIARDAMRVPACLPA